MVTARYEKIKKLCRQSLSTLTERKVRVFVCITMSVITEEAQLSQRGCATLRIVEIFALLLKVIRNYADEQGRKHMFICP